MIVPARFVPNYYIALILIQLQTNNKNFHKTRVSLYSKTAIRALFEILAIPDK